MSMHKGLLGQSHGGSSVTPGFDRIPVVHMPANVPQSDITLGDYITRKQQQVAFEDVAQEKKLTFDEWWSQYAPRHFSLDDADSVKVYYQHGWEMGQENK